MRIHEKLETLIDGFLAILFPKPQKVRALEKSTISEMHELLPPAPKQTQPWITSLFSYKNPYVRLLIKEIKYKRNSILTRKAAATLLDHLIEEIADEISLRDDMNYVLVPIPLSRKRRSDRGYNQSELLVAYMEELDKGESFTINTTLLAKQRETVPQTKTSSRSERLKNLTDCFKVEDSGFVSGRNFVLIDDVTTTGATLSEARKVLMRAGARQVKAITIAH